MKSVKPKCQFKAFKGGPSYLFVINVEKITLKIKVAYHIWTEQGSGTNAGEINVGVDNGRSV